MTDKSQLADLVDARREDDIHASMAYHSRVSPTHKYVCMTIPKIACTRVKLTLLQFEGQPEPEDIGEIHNMGQRLADFKTSEIVEMLLAPDWFRFCFVRNPYDRLLSAYKTQVGNIWNDEYGWLKSEIKEAFSYPAQDNDPECIVAFRDFVRYLHNARSEVRYDGHFNVQANILMQDIIVYDFIGRFEDFASEFERILTRLQAPSHILATASDVQNATYKLHPAIAYDKELADTVCSMYQSDFEGFGYSPDSWMFGYE